MCPRVSVPCCGQCCVRLIRVKRMTICVERRIGTVQTEIFGSPPRRATKKSLASILFVGRAFVFVVFSSFHSHSLLLIHLKHSFRTGVVHKHSKHFHHQLDHTYCSSTCNIQFLSHEKNSFQNCFRFFSRFVSLVDANLNQYNTSIHNIVCDHQNERNLKFQTFSFVEFSTLQ